MELLNPICASTAYPTKSVAFSGTAGTTSDWPTGVDALLVWADAPCYFILGVGVTATATNATAIPQNTPILFKNNSSITGSGAPFRASAIEIGSAGTVY